VERVLTEADADRADDFRRILRCAHRMLLELCFTPPQPQPSRLRAERGRAIPLADICNAANLARFRPALAGTISVIDKVKIGRQCARRAQIQFVGTSASGNLDANLAIVADRARMEGELFFTAFCGLLVSHWSAESNAAMWLTTPEF
jgi:hypothetical protein